LFNLFKRRLVKKDNRTKILSAALKLLNEQDSQSVTTNHIAEAAEVSTGNLYYHFKNKEEIIRELYGQMRDEIGFESQPLPETLCEMQSYCDYVAKVWWKYRFLRRELHFLMTRDDLFAKDVITDIRLQREKMILLLSHLRDKGYIELAYDNMLNNIADTMMLYSHFWTPYLYIIGEEIDVSKAQMVTERIEELLRPFLTKKAKTELAKCQ